MVLLHKPCAASAERCRRSGARYAGLCTLKKDDGRFRRRNARSHCLWQRTHQLTQNIITYILPICGTRNSGPAIPSVSGRDGDGTFRVPIVGLRGFYGYTGEKKNTLIFSTSTHYSARTISTMCRCLLRLKTSPGSPALSQPIPVDGRRRRESI